MNLLLVLSILILFNFPCQGQERISDSTKLRSYYMIVEEYSDTYATGTLITSYCKNLKKLPQSPLELLEYCLSNWHPNDIIIDDFDLDELRIIEFEGQIVIYYLGPDRIDDKCLEVIEDFKGFDFNQFLNLKGDFILGAADLKDLKFYMKGKVD